MSFPAARLHAHRAAGDRLETCSWEEPNMRLINAMLGPRRDDPDVVTLREQCQREANGDEWTTAQARAAAAAERRLSPAVVRVIEQEAGR